MSDICECGHDIDDHDFDDMNELGCSICGCKCFIEKEEDIDET